MIFIVRPTDQFGLATPAPDRLPEISFLAETFFNIKLRKLLFFGVFLSLRYWPLNEKRETLSGLSATQFPNGFECSAK